MSPRSLILAWSKNWSEKAHLTRDDQIAGTPHYLAPEMITSPDDVGPQVDLYALGCLGYYLLTGHTVFEGRTVVEICSHHLHSQPVTPEERIGWPVTKTLSAVVMSCVEKTPNRRPESVAILKNMLEACNDVEPWTNEDGAGVVGVERTRRDGPDASSACEWPIAGSSRLASATRMLESPPTASR